MTNDEFVRVIYKNVLGRTGMTAPPDEGVQHWAADLASGRATKGSLIQTRLNSAHSFNLSAAPAVEMESYAGRHTGTYGGSASGTFDLMIDAAGVISGTAVEPEEQFTISGSVNTSNGTSVMNIGGDAGGVAFQGTINVVSGAISGTWGGGGESGTFSGSR